MLTSPSSATPPKIYLVQYHPYHPGVSMLDSYNEVVETFEWGFRALGYDVKRLMNSIGVGDDALNIVFGWQVMGYNGLIDMAPPNTIFFNFERYSDAESVKENLAQYVVSRFQVWDYNAENVAIWNAINPKFTAYYAPISYAPALEKITQGVEQDIDVLYFGNISPDRVEPLLQVCKQKGLGLSVVTLCNVWGHQRDEFIARAKVVVNFSLGTAFEIVRVSYLMANRKAVISNYTDATIIEPDIAKVLRLVKTEDLGDACRALVADDAGRKQYEQACYTAFQRRNILDIITPIFPPLEKAAAKVQVPQSLWNRVFGSASGH